METGLQKIMELFGIQGITLADVCHVTGAMITFWKNGDRYLNYDNDACIAIANYVFKLFNANRTIYSSKLQNIFNDFAIKINVDTATEGDLIRSLILLVANEKKGNVNRFSFSPVNNFCSYCNALSISRQIHEEIVSPNAGSSLYFCITGSGIELNDNIISEVASAAALGKDIKIILPEDKNPHSRASFFTNYFNVLSMLTVRVYQPNSFNCGFFSEFIMIIPGKSVLTVCGTGSEFYSLSVLRDSSFADLSSEKYDDIIKNLKPVILSNYDISLRDFNNRLNSVCSGNELFIYTKRSLLNPLFMSVEAYTKWLYDKHDVDFKWKIDLFSERKKALEAYISSGNIYYEYNILNIYQSFEDFDAFVETDDLFDEPNPPSYVVHDIVNGYIRLLSLHYNFKVRFYSDQKHFICDLDSAFISSEVFYARKSNTRLYSKNECVIEALSSSFIDLWNSIKYFIHVNEKNAIIVLKDFIEKYDEFKRKEILRENNNAPHSSLLYGTYPAVINDGKYLINEKWLQIAKHYNYFAFYDSIIDDYEIILCDKNNGKPIPLDGAIPLIGLPSPDKYHYAYGCGNKICLAKYLPEITSAETEVIDNIIDQYSLKPDEIAAVPSEQYKNNSDIKHLVFPAESLSIEERAFLGCYSLKTVDFSPKTISIGSEAFKHCTSLLSVEIPRSVCSIGSAAFFGCSSLKFAVIKTDFDIPERCFADCSSLFSVDISPYCENIRNGAFSGCSSFKKIRLPRSLRNIGDTAFQGTMLEEVIIPPFVSLIGEGAFSGCTELRKIEIPSSVKIIGKNAFAGCSGLTIITPENSTAWRYAIENKITVRQY